MQIQEGGCAVPVQVLWLSQHEASDEQEAALREFFGDGVKIVPDKDTFDDACDIERRFKGGNYDEMVVVGPYSLLDELVRRGLRPIRSRGWQQGSRYHFQGFERFKGFLTEPLEKKKQVS